LQKAYSEEVLYVCASSVINHRRRKEIQYICGEYDVKTVCGSLLQTVKQTGEKDNKEEYIVQ
jgi:hypothetical protein